MPGADDLQADVELIRDLTIEAGKIALRWFGKDPEVWMKEGQSPVSEADFAVDDFLKKNLLEHRPDYGWLSEETEDNDDRMGKHRTFVVDPIDGTRGFIQGMDRWCVSVAIVENNRPIAGVLECPVMEQTIVAARGQGTTLNSEPLRLSKFAPKSVLRIAGPRSIANTMFDSKEQEIEKSKFIPSLAYRIGMVAMDEIDLSLARGSAKDWDLAAADLIVHEAGATLTNIEGETLRYNCRDLRHGSLVASHAENHKQMLEFARQAMDKQTAT